MLQLLDPLFIVKTAGVVGVILVIFAESGLFFGFFLPGDSLLFTAGILASQGFINFWVLLFGTMLAAIIGDSVGYAFGKRVGPALFSKDDSFFFKKTHVEATQRFYAAHGKKTLILARFMPIVRTFAPILAGVGGMSYRTFVIYNIAGGILWTASMTILGYFLGSVIPDPDRYILPIVLFIVVISFVPGIVHILKSRKVPKA